MDVTKANLQQINSLLKQLSENFKKISVADLAQILHQENVYVLRARYREHRNKCIGLGLIYLVKTFSKYAAVIEDVIVDRDHRGRGLGKKIMQALIKVAEDKGVDFIDLTSNPKRRAAIYLYKKLGFKKRKTNCYRLYLNKRK